MKPFLKWVGGKTQIIDQLVSKWPTQINNYREIFLGGGSVLLAFLEEVAQQRIRVTGSIYAYDINEPLIHVYKNIQDDERLNELFDQLDLIVDQYRSITNDGDLPINRKPKTIDEATMSRESYYYWIRTTYNGLTANAKNSPYGSARFIFLNKTCFRGIFRVGPNGFNVPFGHYRSVRSVDIYNKDHLRTISRMIANVHFQCLDFSQSLTHVEDNDFIYLDPPYVPEKQTSFVGYTENGFNIDKHKRLFDMIHQISTISTISTAKIMMCNSNVSTVVNSFTIDRYTINEIVCRRAIHSKHPDSKTTETIITNY